MDCSRSREYLSAYVDGRLGRRHRLALGAHLDACEDCRDALEDYRAMKSLLAQTHGPGPEPGFWDRALAAIASGGRARTRLPARIAFDVLPRWHRRAGWAALAAACALAVLMPVRLQQAIAEAALGPQRVIGWHARYCRAQSISDRGSMWLAESRARLADSE